MHIIHTLIEYKKRLLIVPIVNDEQAGIASFNLEQFDIVDGQVTAKSDVFAITGITELKDFKNSAPNKFAREDITELKDFKNSAPNKFAREDITELKDFKNSAPNKFAREGITDLSEFENSAPNKFAREDITELKDFKNSTPNKFAREGITDLSEFENKSNNKFIRKDDMVNIYEYKGSVSYYSELPSNASNGDVWNVSEAYRTNPSGTNYAWVDNKIGSGHWDPLGGDLSQISTVGFSGDYMDLKNTIPIMTSEKYRKAELVEIFPVNPSIGDVVKREEAGGAICHYYWNGSMWKFVFSFDALWTEWDQLVYSYIDSSNNLRATFPMQIQTNRPMIWYGVGLLPLIDGTEMWFENMDSDDPAVAVGFGRNYTTVKWNPFYPVEGGFDDGDMGRTEPPAEDVSISTFYYTLVLTHLVWNVFQAIGDGIDYIPYGESQSIHVTPEEYLSYWAKHIGLSIDDYSKLMLLFIEEIIAVDDNGETGEIFTLKKQVIKDGNEVIGYDIVVKLDSSPKETVFTFMKDASENIVQFHDADLSALGLGILSSKDTIDTNEINNYAVTNAKLGTGSVTNVKLAEMPAKTIKGNKETSSATPTDLSAADVRTLLNVADGAQVNVIESIYVNGSMQSPDTNKAVSLSIPSISGLESASNKKDTFVINNTSVQLKTQYPSQYGMREFVDNRLSFTYTGTFGQWVNSLSTGMVAAAMGKPIGDCKGIYKVVFFNWNVESESILKQVNPSISSWTWNILTCWFFVVDMSTVHFRFVTDKGGRGGRGSMSTSDFHFDTSTSSTHKGYVTEYIPT